MEKIVKFYIHEKRKRERFLCELEEIPQSEEEKYFGSDVDIVKWSYGFGKDGYFYHGKLIGKTKFVDEKYKNLWLFKHPDEKVSMPSNMFYNNNQPSTRGKLFKLVKKIRKIKEVNKD